MKAISREEVLDRLKAENPWWDPPHQAPARYAGFNPRPYLGLLYPLVTNRAVQRAVVLMGPRRVGKTVMIHHAIDRLLRAGTLPRAICYISIDHPIYTGLGLEQLVQLYGEAAGVDLSKEKCFLFFDEVQYLKNWEQHLKSLVDDHPSIKMLASGSAAAALRLKSSESGAGRFTDFLLPPLTFHEYLDLQGLQQFAEPEDRHDGTTVFRLHDIEGLNEAFLSYINFGGYPEVALSPEIQQDPGRFIRSDIIDKVLLRDLPSLYGIRDVQELNQLFTVLAFNTAGEVSLEQLAQGSGVAKNTIKRYIEYLEAAFLLKTVEKVDRGARRFKRATFFKVYLTNPSMRSALFAPVQEGDPSLGAMVETAVFAQFFHQNTPLYYARWRSGEVDVVHLGDDQKVQLAIEVKFSDRYPARPHELKSLLSFCHAQNLPRCAVTTRTIRDQTTVSNVEVLFVPASLYCFVTGYEIVSAKKPNLLE